MKIMHIDAEHGQDPNAVWFIAEGEAEWCEGFEIVVADGKVAEIRDAEAEVAPEEPAASDRASEDPGTSYRAPEGRDGSGGDGGPDRGHEGGRGPM